MTDKIVDALIYRLHQRGFVPEQITRLIKDVYYVNGEGGDSNLEEVNRHLYIPG